MKEKIIKLTKTNKKILVVLTILIFGLVTMLSFAYLGAKVWPDVQNDFSGTGTGYNSISFSTSGDISYELTSETFGFDAENIVNTVEADAKFTVKTGETYTDFYNVYLEFSNEFVYSTSDKTPEIILTITDPDGIVLEEVSNLEYVTVDEVSGFDITDASGIYEVELDRVVSVTSELTENWTFTVTIIAHDFDQSVNEGANFDLTVYLQQEYME